VFAAPGSTLWRFDGAQWAAVSLPLGGSLRCLATTPDGALLLGGRMGGFFPGPVESSVWRYAAGVLAPLAGGTADVFDMKVLADGSLVVVGGPDVLRWDGVAWQSLGVSNADSTSSGWLAALPNGELAVGGTFSSIGGAAIANLARWDGTAWRALATAAPTGSVVGAVADDGTVFTAGNFFAAGPHVAWGFAMASAHCPASVGVVGAGCTGSGGPLALQPRNRPWAGGTFVATASGFPPMSLGLHVIGLTGTSVPLPGGAPGCGLFVVPVVTDVLVPTSGTATASLPIPSSVALAGLGVLTQVVGLELGSSGELVRLTGTNALDLTLGAF
jgi:hypothetical protein